MNAVMLGSRVPIAGTNQPNVSFLSQKVFPGQIVSPITIL